AVPGKLTLSLSAPLMSMMADELLSARCQRHLETLIALSEAESARTRGEATNAKLAAFYLERFQNLHHFYVEELGRDVIGAFRRFFESGRIELITCVGTHPILPFQATEGGRRAQVRAACELFESYFGRRPRGIWLAECAFSPGMDRFLAEEGICYSFLEEIGINAADSAPIYGNIAPLISEHDVAFFGRDQLASAQVWSASEGYPGDYFYREFYRDIGFDLPLEDIGPYIHPDGIRHNTGLKYNRITGDVALGDKAPYDPEVAYHKAWEHGAHFVSERVEQGRRIAEQIGERGSHMTCPYDAELFGHWWFEGPIFLEALFHRAAEQDELIMSSPVDFLGEVDVQQKTTPATSTWGEDGYFAVWLDESNAWTYRHLRNAETMMVELATDFQDAGGLQERALRQAGREVLLAQSSDWPFIIKTGTTVEYAVARIEEHVENFRLLHAGIRKDSIDEAFLADIEARNNIFPNLDWKAWIEA
ncbi:MAG: glycoside hydrolase family 57 protein, partial [Bradymonadaceae bacterium]